MTEPSLTALTQSRSALVAKAAEACEADLSLLLLVDSLGSHVSLWLSYGWSMPKHGVELPLNQIVQLPFEVGASLSEKVLGEEAEAYVRGLDVSFQEVVHPV